MANLPPNMPIPVPQPPGRVPKCRITNYDLNKNCDIVIMNNNIFPILVTYNIGGTQNSFIEPPPKFITIRPNETSDITVSKAGDPLYIGPIIIQVVNLTNDNFQVVISDFTVPDAVLCKLSDDFNEFKADISLIKEKLGIQPITKVVRPVKKKK